MIGWVKLKNKCPDRNLLAELVKTNVLTEICLLNICSASTVPSHTHTVVRYLLPAGLREIQYIHYVRILEIWLKMVRGQVFAVKCIKGSLLLELVGMLLLRYLP